MPFAATRPLVAQVLATGTSCSECWAPRHARTCEQSAYRICLFGQRTVFGQSFDAVLTLIAAGGTLRPFIAPALICPEAHPAIRNPLAEGVCVESHPQRRATAVGALVAAAALLAVGIQATSATADATASKAPAAAKSNPGAANLKLSASERATLLAEANSTTAQAAKTLGLGSGEKLVVRDVVKDADGTTHTTYERTYDGLPVLGGDLTIHAKDGVTKSVTKATHHEIKVDTTATVTPAAAESQAISAANAEGAKDAKPSKNARKVVWAAEGAPVLAFETVVGGMQHDGTPSELHVVTDAKTGAKITEWQAVETGTGNTMYSGQVTIGTSQSGSNFTLNDATRGGHKTNNLNRATSGTGTLFSGTDDIWGNGLPANLETAAADAHYGAQVTWDYYKNVHGRNGLRNDGVSPYSRVHYGNNYVNAFWQDSCFCMTYGDGDGNAKPLTSTDVAAHEMTHGLTSVTGNMTYSGEPGGLNEATSDIFAAAVEFYANNPQDVGDYLVGEKIDIRGNGTRCATWTSRARTARPRTPGTRASARSTSTTPRARPTTGTTWLPRARAPRSSTA